MPANEPRMNTQVDRERQGEETLFGCCSRTRRITWASDLLWLRGCQRERDVRIEGCSGEGAGGLHHHEIRNPISYNTLFDPAVCTLAYPQFSYVCADVYAVVKVASSSVGDFETNAQVAS